MAALLFLYAHVLEQPLAPMSEVVHARRPARLPVVMTREEVRALLARLSGTPRLMASLLYGSGLRLQECVQLRVKDVDLRTTMIYTHVLGRGALGVRSPLDAMVDGPPISRDPSSLPGSHVATRPRGQ